MNIGGTVVAAAKGEIGIRAAAFAAMAGISLVAASMWLIHSVDVPRTVGTGPESRLESASTVHVRTAGPLVFRRSRVSLSYPAEMRENETRTVDLGYTSRIFLVEMSRTSPSGLMSTDPPRPQELDQLAASIRVGLSSSGFTIEPKGIVSRKAGTPLPIRQLWTITPKGEGVRDLVLQIEEEFTREDGPPRYEATINSQVVKADRSGIYRLPVTVKTYMGVAKATSTIATQVMAIVGAILCYPIVIALVKRMLGLPEKA